MKKGTKLLLLLAALAVAVGCFLLVSSLFGEEEPDAQSEEETVSVYRVESDDIVGMQFDLDGESHAFSFASDEWQDATGADRPLEQSSMDALATVCANWTAKRVVSDHPESTAEYGLDSPVLQIQLTLRDGASVTLLIGDYSEAGEGDYLSLSGSDTVYLVASSARTAITNNLNTCYMEASDAE